MNTRQEIIVALGGENSWIHNWSLGGCKFYGEIMDDATFGVWLSSEPISPDDYADLVAPEGFRKSGVGRSEHDAAFFLRPPGADVDGPVSSIVVDGRSFGLVARPGKPESGFTGVMVLPVYKSHRLFFASGRTLELLDTGDGFSLVPQAVESHLGRRKDPTIKRQMPNGWTSRHITLKDNLVIDLPCPARVAIFKNGDIFHGPVQLDLPT